MELSLLFIVIGIILWALVSSALGVACIVIGLLLLLWPTITGGRAK